MNPDAGTPKNKKTTKAKAPKSKGPERIKCSLLLSKENDIRLTVLAAMKGTDRSTLANTIFDDALRGVVVSLRGQLSESGAGEGGQIVADEEAA